MRRKGREERRKRERRKGVIDTELRLVLLQQRSKIKNGRGLTWWYTPAIPDLGGRGRKNKSQGYFDHFESPRPGCAI